jgi:hypothetical protein
LPPAPVLAPCSSGYLTFSASGESAYQSLTMTSVCRARGGAHAGRVALHERDANADHAEVGRHALGQPRPRCRARRAAATTQGARRTRARWPDGRAHHGADHACCLPPCTTGAAPAHSPVCPYGHRCALTHASDPPAGTAGPLCPPRTRPPP